MWTRIEFIMVALPLLQGPVIATDTDALRLVDVQILYSHDARSLAAGYGF